MGLAKGKMIPSQTRSQRWEGKDHFCKEESPGNTVESLDQILIGLAFRRTLRGKSPLQTAVLKNIYIYLNQYCSLFKCTACSTINSSYPFVSAPPRKRHPAPLQQRQGWGRASSGAILGAWCEQTFNSSVWGKKGEKKKHITMKTSFSPSPSQPCADSSALQLAACRVM